MGREQDEIRAKVSADLKRVELVARGILTKCYELSGERGEENFRVDSVAMVAVVAWTDENGDEREDVVMGSETTRHHVKIGIIEAMRDSLRGVW